MTRSVSTALPPAHVPSGNRPDVRLPRCQAPLVKTVSRASKPKPLCVVSARHGCATDGVQGARRYRSKHLSAMDARIPPSACPDALSPHRGSPKRLFCPARSELWLPAKRPCATWMGNRLATQFASKRLSYRHRHHFAMDARIPQSVYPGALPPHCGIRQPNACGRQAMPAAATPDVLRTGDSMASCPAGKRLSI